MTNEQELFIENIAHACVELYEEYFILPSMAIAQAIKESNWGKSKLASVDFNFFGMKWTSTCGCDHAEYSTKEWDSKNNKYITIKAKFRKYKDFKEGMRGYFKFITGYKRYNNLIGEIDSHTACINIAKDGWATAPNYGESLYKDYVIPYDLIKYDDIVLHRNKKVTVETVKEVAPSKAIPKTYTVVKGDTLWGISKKLYGNGIYWRRIYDCNNMKNTLIVVGQVLKLPN